MSPQLQAVLVAALQLPESERGELVSLFFDTFEEPEDSLDDIPEFHPEWEDEIRRRVEDLRSGREPGIPWEVVREQMEEIAKVGE